MKVKFGTLGRSRPCTCGMMIKDEARKYRQISPAHIRHIVQHRGWGELEARPQKRREGEKERERERDLLRHLHLRAVDGRSVGPPGYKSLPSPESSPCAAAAAFAAASAAAAAAAVAPPPTAAPIFSWVRRNILGEEAEQQRQQQEEELEGNVMLSKPFRALFKISHQFLALKTPFSQQNSKMGKNVATANSQGEGDLIEAAQKQLHHHGDDGGEVNSAQVLHSSWALSKHLRKSKSK